MLAGIWIPTEAELDGMQITAKTLRSFKLVLSVSAYVTGLAPKNMHILGKAEPFRTSLRQSRKRQMSKAAR